MTARSGTIRIAALVGLLGLVLSSWMMGARPAAADDGGDEAAFIAKINSLRVSKGLGQLSVDAQLTQTARNWSAHMRDQRSLSHNPNLSSQAPSNWRKLAENIGTGDTVDQVFDAFVQSSKHYANMTDPELTSFGVGVVRASDGRLWTTHDFMATQAAQPSPATTQPRPSAPPQTAPPTTRRGETPRGATAPAATAAPPTSAAPTTTEAPTTTTTAAPPSTEAPATTVAPELVGPEISAPTSVRDGQPVPEAAVMLARARSGGTSDSTLLIVTVGAGCLVMAGGAGVTWRLRLRADRNLA